MYPSLNVKKPFPSPRAFVRSFVRSHGAKAGKNRVKKKEGTGDGLYVYVYVYECM